MTNFTDENILVDGMYVHFGAQGWQTPHAERKFIARFKHVPGTKRSFISFLKKNFTVEEYFGIMDQKVLGQGPLTILMAKGYLQPHIKKWLKRDGYPVTPEGYQAYISAQTAKTLARIDAEKAAKTAA